MNKPKQSSHVCERKPIQNFRGQQTGRTVCVIAKISLLKGPVVRLFH